MTKLFLFLAILIATNLSFSQTQYGIKAGAGYVNNISDFEPNFFTANYIDADYKYRLSYQFGGFLTTPISENLRLRIELLLASKGNKTELPNTNTFNLKLTYINIPILAQYVISEQFGVEVGPEFGYLISAKVKSKGNDASDVKDLYEDDFDIGISGGIRYFYSDIISFNVRYIHGLLKVREDIVFDQSTGSQGGVDNFYNRAFQLSISYRLK